MMESLAWAAEYSKHVHALAEEEQEQGALVKRLDKTCISDAEKTKLMTNSANGIQRKIKVKGQKMGTVTSFLE